MGIYLDIQDAYLDMVTNLLTDEILVKLIYYDDADPLSHPAVQSPASLIYNGNDEKDKSEHRIFLVDKLPEIVNDKKTFIIPTLKGTKPSSHNYRMDFVIEFKVATHLSMQSLKDNGVRILQIMDRIHTLYNSTEQEHALGQSNTMGSSEWRPSMKWSGRTMSYRFTGNNMECDD